jgi:histidinol-phosphatase (PHP family)
MYLVDYHTHSRCSPDSDAPLLDMAEAARRAGLRELCTTDHCDLQQEDGTSLGQWDWSPILQQYAQTQARCSAPDFRLLLGLELGGGHTDPARAEALLSGAPLDFVIGSVHNLSPAAGGRDFYFLDYPTQAVCRQAMDDYFASLLALAPLPCYDTLGHILYPLRYMNGRAGHHIALEDWSDQLDLLLRTVIQTGRAIEVNTHAGQEIAEWRPILERYRQLGGEYITLGSDAHQPAHVGKGLSQAHALLLDTGFRWLTVYRQRQPEQIKL